MTNKLSNMLSAQHPSGYRWLVTILLVLIVAGIGFLWGSTHIDEHSVWHHLVRDVGIAFLVSALVTASYEGYLRQKVDLEKLESVLRTVAGSNIPVTVWQQIQLRLLARQVIRRGMHLKVTINRSQHEPNLCELGIVLEYRLVSLSKEHTLPYRIEHVLDAHLATEGVQRPIFRSFGIGATTFGIGADGKPDNADSNLTVAGDRLHYDTELAPVADAMASGAGVKVSVTRNEVRSAPGSYMLIMSELTDSVTIELTDVSPDLVISVLVWPEDFAAGGPKALAKGGSITVNQILLPGHTIEVRIGVKP
jgi:hypothetical protein